MSNTPDTQNVFTEVTTPDTPDTQDTLTEGTTRAAPGGGGLPDGADLSRGQASNFVAGSVDPRTGCYNFQFPILDVVANEGLGPHLSIGIQYNPYTVPDRDYPNESLLPFGCTFSGLTVLHFDPTVAKCSGTLSTGVSVEVKLASDTELELLTHTVKNVVFRQETGGQDYYVNLTFESGRIERLKLFIYAYRDGDEYAVLLPVEIYDPSGHSVTLEWTGGKINGIYSYPKLNKIGDSYTTYLAANGSGFAVVMPAYEASGMGAELQKIYLDSRTKSILKDVAPDVRMDVRVLSEIYRVTKKGQVIQSCKIDYQEIQVERSGGYSYGSLLFINSISTNTGLSETIEYKNDAFQYPRQYYGINSIWRNHPLPGVSKHIIRPGFDSQPIYKKYQYTLENSYLGGGFVETDNPFYHFISDNYLLEQNFSTTGSNPTYSSIELFVDAQETHVYKQIHRIYNMYHLLVSEETSFDLPVTDYHLYPSTFHRVSYEYPLIENKPLKEQPLTYQFPTKISQYWQDKNANGQKVSREESTTYTYNERGHTIREVHPNGATVDRSFVYVNPWEKNTPSSDLKKIVVLLAQEESGYQIKSEDSYKDIYPTRNVYYYKSSPSLMNGINFYCLEKIETYNFQSMIEPRDGLVAVTAPLIATLIKTKQNIYNLSLDITTLHTKSYGRLQESVETIDKFRQIKTSYVFEKSGFGGLLKKTTQTNLFVWNETSQSFVESTLAYRKTTASTLQLMLTGQIVSETSELGLVSKYEYDTRGRLSKKTECVGTSYEASKEFSYEIASPTGNVIIQKDGLGVISKSYVDGLGRVMRLSKVIDGSEFVYEQCVYDELGRLKETRSFDDAQGQAIENLTRYQHDKWSQLAKTTSYTMANSKASPTELHTITIADPIALTVISYTEGANKVQSGQTKTYLDINRQVIKTELVGEANSSVQSFYDVAGKLRRVLDQQGIETTYTYDAIGRTSMVQYGYGHTVRYHYLVSNSPSPVQSIQIITTDKETLTMGLREYNDALQLIKETVGGRVKQFRYADMMSPPSEMVQPDGTVQYMNYIPELGHALKETYTSKNTINKKSFIYDRWGRLINDSCYTPEQEMHRNSYHYDTEGRLINKQSEFLTHVFTQTYTYSKMSRVLSENNSEGGNQSYTYNKLGRISSVTTKRGADVIENVVGYSPLGYVVTYLSDKINTAQPYGPFKFLRAKLYYDNFGRETYRSTYFENYDGSELTQSQHIIATAYDLKSRKARESIWVYSNDDEKDPTMLEQRWGRSIYYTYDKRNRLFEKSSSLPTSTSDALPVDHTGNPVLTERFRYEDWAENDALNNLGAVETGYLINRNIFSETTTYSYDNPNDRTQLTKVRILGRKEFDLAYDANGCLTKDEAGRQLTYNHFGELAFINGGQQRYWYDAHGKLVAQSPNPNVIKHFHSDINGMRSVEVAFVRDAYGKLTKQTPTHFHNAFGVTLAIEKDNTFRHLGVNRQGSTVAELKQDKPTSYQDKQTSYSYTSYGTNKTPRDIPGFNGEFADEITGVTHLGKGYRAYNPVLMRFHCPDSWSPFGAGGINPYVYCAGDPINFSDPSGHSHTAPYSGLAYIFAGLVIGAGLALVVASGGGALAIGVGLTLGVASGALTIASMAVAGYDHGLSNRLGIAADVIGLIDMAQGIGTSIFAAVGAGRSVAGVAEEGITTWGKNAHTNRHLGPISATDRAHVTTFLDEGVISTDLNTLTVNRGPRLNIMVHGEQGMANPRARAWDIWQTVQRSSNAASRRAYTAEQITSIEGIRLISCYAGEPGGVASHLAVFANKPVKSYIGSVHTRSFKNLSRIHRMQNNVVLKPYRIRKSYGSLSTINDYQVAIYNPDGSLNVSYTYRDGVIQNI